MRDVYGEIVQGALIRMVLGDGWGDLDAVTGHDGRMDVPDRITQLHCGDFLSPYLFKESSDPIEIPGAARGTFGELAILPLGWGELKVSPEDKMAWRHSVATDPHWGHRFLYLRPGTYDVANVAGQVLGKTTVKTGERTTYTVAGISGLKINISFVVEPTVLPEQVIVRHKELSQDRAPGTWMGVKRGQRTYSALGLAPGNYRVYVDEGEYVFSEYIQLLDGQVHSIVVRLNAKP